ncbi:MAG: ParB/RepB/Spo0J family partition protein [Pseudomonadota bacterium]
MTQSVDTEMEQGSLAPAASGSGSLGTPSDLPDDNAVACRREIPGDLLRGDVVGVAAEEALGDEPTDILAALKAVADAHQGTHGRSAKSKANRSDPRGRSATMSLSQITKVPALLQPRQVSERHVEELCRVVRDRGSLDPVSVFRVGPLTVLVDGHHRLAAYRAERVTKAVPVRIFDWTVEEAVLAAGEANSKAKLPMDTRQRHDRAWLLVRLGYGFTKKQIAKSSGVSERTVGYMRRAKRTLEKSDEYEPSSFDHWWQARKAAFGQFEQFGQMDEEEREAWEETKARAFADKLSHVLGPSQPHSNEVVARGLAIYLGRNAGQVAASLKHLARDDDDDEPGEDEIPF